MRTSPTSATSGWVPGRTDTLKLTIFGPTGGTGRQLVEQALAAGHKVIAVAREPRSIITTDPNLLVVEGNVLEHGPLWAGMEGSDAVLSALGTHAMKEPTNIYSQGTAAILAAMSTVGIERLIAISAIPLVPKEHKSWLEHTLVHPVLNRFFGGGYQDMRRMEAMLEASSIKWTIFRPSRLTDKPKTGGYRTAIDSHLRRAWSLSRADLADAMLQAISDQRLARRTVAIAN